MISKEQAAELLRDQELLGTKFLKRITDLPDPFNAPNCISGWISQKADHRYGALIIDAVNGQETPTQLIWGMPKLHYPFGFNPDTNEREYTWGVVHRVEAYNKFCGTNVLAYRYHDAKGKPYISFKFRRNPFMGNNRYGNLLDLWNECLDNTPELLRRCLEMPNNWFPAFEMYGYKNPHTVAYDIPIDFIHLCMVGQGENSGKIEVPYKFDFVKTNRPTDAMENGKELTAFYEKLRKQANVVNRGKTEYGGILSEGYVMYALGTKGWELFKIKPECVEDIHWNRKEWIGVASITETCWNAFEHTDNLTYKVLCELLLEEYEQEIIDEFSKRIKKVLTKVKSKQRIKEKALSIYKTLPSEVREGGRSSVMRAMSKEFQKSEIVTCFNMLRSAGVFEDDKGIQTLRVTKV